MHTDRRPPDFFAARNRRQKVRAAGMDPDYWYAVEYDRKIGRGQVVEVKFWGRSFALFRGQDGALRAIENRCAHRQLKLSLGVVEGNSLVCPYHGWGFDGCGKLVSVQHDLFGKPMPSYKLDDFPLQVRYGLVWLFPGDRRLAEVRRIPEIPELELSPRERWGCVPIDATWQAHHSMIIDNVSDFSHAFLHRRFKPFWDAKLLHLEAAGDQVHVGYRTRIGGGRITQYFVDRKEVATNTIELCYDYPYQRSNTDGKIKHWLFVLPIDERTTRGFFLFYFDHFKVPFLPLHFPRWAMDGILRLANRLHITPLLAEDGMACEAEQAGYEAHFDQPIAEVNPAVHLFQNLTIRKWEEHLRRAGRLPTQPADGPAPAPLA